MGPSGGAGRQKINNFARREKREPRVAAGDRLRGFGDARGFIREMRAPAPRSAAAVMSHDSAPSTSWPGGWVGRW